MSPEETQQVNQYIANLQKQHEVEVARLKFYATQQAGKITAVERALVEIDKVCLHPETTPTMLRACVPQILNYYCPDYWVPF